MRFSHRRLLALGTLAACALSLAALPALARSATAQSVNVTVNSTAEFTFKLSTKTVKVGTVAFKMTNNGILPHDLKVCSAASSGDSANACTGKVTPLIDPGSTKTLTVTFKKAGKYEYLCTVPGHAASGMKGILTVKA